VGKGGVGPGRGGAGGAPGGGLRRSAVRADSALIGGVRSVQALNGSGP